MLQENRFFLLFAFSVLIAGEMSKTDEELLSQSQHPPLATVLEPSQVRQPQLAQDPEPAQPRQPLLSPVSQPSQPRQPASVHEKLERKSSKSRLSKQDEVEVAEEGDHHSSTSAVSAHVSSRTCNASVLPQVRTEGDRVELIVDQRIMDNTRESGQGESHNGATARLVSRTEVGLVGSSIEPRPASRGADGEEDHSPNSDGSDRTVVPAGE